MHTTLYIAVCIFTFFSYHIFKSVLLSAVYIFGKGGGMNSVGKTVIDFPLQERKDHFHVRIYCHVQRPKTSSQMQMVN